MRARVVVLAGPSGSGKSRLAARLGLPLVRLDDFYREGADPALPMSFLGIVDWDDPRSWDADAACALETLARDDVADVPVYDIAANARAGRRTVLLGGATCLVAEGLFAPELSRSARAAACSLTRSAYATLGSSPSYCGWFATCASTASPRSCCSDGGGSCCARSRGSWRTPPVAAACR